MIHFRSHKCTFLCRHQDFLGLSVVACQAGGPGQAKSDRSHNSRSGLTLIESLLSIAVVTMLMSPIFVINNQIIRGVNRYAQTIDRTLQAKTFLIKAAFAVGASATEHPTQFEKKIDNPKTFMRYEQKKIDKKSTLGEFTDLSMHQVSLRWQDHNGVPRTDTLISFVFQPVLKKDKQ